uniref:Uncharacterized protein n=1 Tax=Panagrolaimus sp. JU765 TaxID=591449 RepID=A0AC34QQV7_9BILA
MASVSQYFLWLFKRAKPKKIVKHLELFRNQGQLQLSLIRRPLEFKSNEELTEFLDKIQIKSLKIPASFTYDKNIGLSSPNRASWLRATKFSQKLIYRGIITGQFLDLIKNFKDLRVLWLFEVQGSSLIFLILYAVQQMAAPENLNITGDMDDRILDLLIGRTSKNSPIYAVELCAKYGFSLGACHRFLQNATFAKNAKIVLKVAASQEQCDNLIQMIGTYVRRDGQLMAPRTTGCLQSLLPLIPIARPEYLLANGIKLSHKVYRGTCKQNNCGISVTLFPSY